MCLRGGLDDFRCEECKRFRKPHASPLAEHIRGFDLNQIHGCREGPILNQRLRDSSGERPGLKGAVRWDRLAEGSRRIARDLKVGVGTVLRLKAG
jgi:hypothetical protein